MQKRLVTFLAVLVLLGAASVQPAHAKVTTEELATLRNVGGMSISPNGRYIVYQVYQPNPQTNRYSNRWFLADTKTGQSRLLIPNGGDPVLTYEDKTAETDYSDDLASFDPVWASDSVFYYVRKDHDHITVHRFSLVGRDTTLAGYAGNVFSFARVDATHVRFSTWAPSAQTIAIHQNELKDGFLYYDGPTDLASAFELDGMKVQNVPHFYSLDLADGSVQPATANAGGLYGISAQLNGLTTLHVTASPDSRTRAFVDWEQHRYRFALYLLPSGAKQPMEVLPLIYDTVGGLQWSPDSRSLYYVGQGNDPNDDIYRLDVATQHAQRVTNDDSYLSDCSYNTNVTLAACTVEKTTAPADIGLVDLHRGKVTLLTHLNPNFRRDVAGIRTRTLVWTNKWGTTLFGTLTYPRGYTAGKRYPLIFLTYWDSGFQRGGSGDEDPIFPLAENGFFVLNVDIRKSQGGALPPTKLASGLIDLPGLEGPLDGMERIGRKLIAQGMVKPGFGIGGLSGGSVTAAYAATHSIMFAAVTEDANGWPEDPIEYYLGGKSSFDLLKSWGLGGSPYGQAYTFWKQISQALNADRTHAAFLMNPNDQEYLLGLQLFWELRDRHKPVEMWIYHDELHTKHQPEHRLSIYNRNVDWFNFWLQGKEDPNPAKRAQYKRWEKLRAEEISNE